MSAESAQKLELRAWDVPDTADLEEFDNGVEERHSLRAFGTSAWKTRGFEGADAMSTI